MTNSEDYLKLLLKLWFLFQKIFNEKSTALYKIKLVWTLKKPAYVRFLISDLSKTFIMVILKKKYGDEAKL